MNRSNNAPLVCCIIGVVAIVITLLISGSSETTTTKEPTNTTTTPSTTYVAPETTTPKVEEKETWHCIDVTSYNKNPYDDNKCTSNKGEVRLVPDSEARKLDPSYTPGTRGHSYYNSF